MDQDIRQLEEALEEDPRDGDALDRLEAAYIEAGRLDDLVDWFESWTSRIEDEDAAEDAWLALAGRLERASEAAVSDDDKRKAGELLYAAGELYNLRLGRKDKAMLCYQKAFKADAGMSHALGAARTIYMEQESWPMVVRLYELQLQVTRDADRRIELLLRVGDVARAAMRFDQAREALDKGLELARTGRRERAVARVLLGQGRVDLAEGRFDAAAGLLARALKLSDGLRDRGLVGRIYGALGETWQKNGDLVRAVDFLGKSVRVAEEEGDTTRLALLLPMLANAAGGAGDSAAAERWIVRALRTAEKTGDDLMRAKVLKAYSLLDYFGGRFEEGLERCVEALAIADEVDSVEDAVILAHNAGDFCMQLDDLKGAFKFFTQSLELCRAHGLTRTELTNEIHLTWLEARRHGNPPPADKAEEVEPKLREQWSRAETLGLKWEALQARWFVARCLAARGKNDSARPLFEQVREGARRIHLQFLVREAESALEAL